MATDRPHAALVIRRYRPDATWERYGRVLVAGSPLRIFRLTDAGGRVLDAIEAGAEIPASTLVDRLLDAGAVHPEIGSDPDPVGRRHTRADVTVVTPQLGGTAADDGRFVVDDGSEPPVVGASIRLPHNVGPAAARNAGRAHVDTALIAFVDADVETGLDSPWLDGVLGHFDDERVGLVAPRVAGERGSPIDLGTLPARIRAGSRVGYVPGAVVVVRATAFDDVGGFDERLRFGEDVDLVWRLDQRGWRCRYEPEATVWHRPRPTLVGRWHQHAGYGTSAAPLALRHPGELSPVHCNGWTLAAWTLLCIGHPFLAAAVAGSSAAALVPKLPDLPARRSLRLALTGHLRAGRQIADATRRVWWPIAVVASLVSRRARRVLLLAVLLDVREAPTDVAYGWGVWRGMRTHRTWAPLVPRLRSWPGGGSRSSRRASATVGADRDR